MSRLTKREKDNVVLVDYDYTEMKEKFLDYVNDVSDCINLETALDKLADYEDKEEQGLLIELPVPIGEEIYSIIGREISRNRVLSYQTAPENVGGIVARGYMGVTLGIVGKNVFATRSEAEEALAKMGGANGTRD